MKFYTKGYVANDSLVKISMKFYSRGFQQILFCIAQRFLQISMNFGSLLMFEFNKEIEMKFYIKKHGMWAEFGQQAQVANGSHVMMK
jgi:hypothetical protein